MKQSQGRSEQGFVLATPVAPGIQVAKNAKNQAKSSQVLTRFSPFATQDKDKDKDKETDDQDHNEEKQENKRQTRIRNTRVEDKKRDSQDKDKKGDRPR